MRYMQSLLIIASYLFVLITAFETELTSHPRITSFNNTWAKISKLDSVSIEQNKGSEQIGHIEETLQPLKNAVSFQNFEDFIYYPKDQQPHSLQQSLLGASTSNSTTSFKNWCNTTNTVNGTCSILNQTIIFTSDYIYTAVNTSIIIQNSKIQCWGSNKACTMTFRLSGGNGTVFSMQNSLIQAKGIIIQAPQSRVIISGNNSYLYASGVSMNTNGTSSSKLDGASYIGSGGACDSPVFKNYGEFDMKPSFTNFTLEYSQTGSAGQANNGNTYGGGRIIIVSDSVQFDGANSKIQADAKPFQTTNTSNTTNMTILDTPGGSGGYVYIATNNFYQNNTIDQKSSISAQGGFGTGKGQGGSGGNVVLDGNFAMLTSQILTNGGFAGNQTAFVVCGNGGAGTIYYAKTDQLLIDGKKIISNQFTTLKIPPAKQAGTNLNYFVANSIQIFSNVIVKVFVDQAISFGQLNMKQNSILRMESTIPALKQNPLNVYFTQNVSLDATSTLDIKNINEFTLNSNLNGVFVTLGNLLYLKYAAISMKYVAFNGYIKLPDAAPATATIASQLWFLCNDIVLNSNCSIKSGFVLIQSNNTLTILPGVTINSYQNNTCNVATSNNTNLFNCLPSSPQLKSYGIQDYMSAFNTQFKQNQTLIQNTIPNLSQNFTVYLLAFGNMSLEGATVNAPKVGLCSPSVLVLNSKIDTNGRGCLSDQGLGKGSTLISNMNCAGSGASHAGNGGFGGINSTNATIQAKCKQNYPQALNFGQEARYEGSGGTSGIKAGNRGGNGGGIIWISSNGTTQLYNSQFLAEGTNGKVDQQNETGSGGGSGGSIQLTTSYLAGNAISSVKGGDGINGGGGGSGGRILVNFLRNSTLSPNMTINWSGTSNQKGGQPGLITQPIPNTTNITNSTQTPNPTKLNQIILQQSNSNTTILQGAPGGDGTLLGTQKCSTGFFGGFCSPCAIGTFLNDTTSNMCLPCQNKPLNSIYNQKAQQSSKCSYECNDGYRTFNGNCSNSFYIRFTNKNGIKLIIIIASIVISFLCLVIWGSLFCWSRRTLSKLEELHTNFYDEILYDDGSNHGEREITGQNMKLTDKEIWSQTHRMYLIGNNTITHQWHITKDFPLKALDETNRDFLLSLIKSQNKEKRWNTIRKDVYLAFRILYPPIARLLHSCIRSSNFNHIQSNIFDGFSSEFWDQRGNKTLRFSTSTVNKQLAYIDFLDLKKTKSNYEGPQLPITLLFSGSGTFSSPYHLNFNEDPLAKSLVHLHEESLKTKLPLFFENLNTLLSKLSFHKFWCQVTQDLKETIKWVEQGNKALFIPNDVQATLYIFENTVTPLFDSEGKFRQQRRSLPLQSNVFDALPEMYTNLIRFIFSKIHNKKVELRFGLVFKPYNFDKNKRLEDRVQHLVQEKKLKIKVSPDLKQSLVFVQDEDDANYSSNRSAAIAASRSFSSKHPMSESNVYVGNEQKRQTVKIIDKSKRAYDISVDSTLALEFSLKKSRVVCNHLCKRFIFSFYSLWISLFNYHGMPPGQIGMIFFGFAYAFLLTVDIALLVSVMFRIFDPISNMKHFGIQITFLYVYPAATVIAPLLGVIASLCGSPTIFKVASSFNATCVAINYPATIIYMLCIKENLLYIIIMSVLLVNKILLSYFGGKVRSNLENPLFAKNKQQLELYGVSVEKSSSNYIYKDFSQKARNINKALRASQLSNKEIPDISEQSLPTHWTADDAQRSKRQTESYVDSDEEKDRNYGIVSGKKIKARGHKSFAEEDLSSDI